MPDYVECFSLDLELLWQVREVPGPDHDPLERTERLHLDPKVQQ